MFKLMGGIMVIAASLLLGRRKERSLKNRAVCLRQLEHSVALMEREIVERLTPLPQLLAMLSRSTGYVGMLFASASKAVETGDEPFDVLWHQALREQKELLLTEAEAEVLGQLGELLGRYSSAQQGAELGRLRERMGEFAAAAETEHLAKGKMLISCAACVGVLAVIVLL